MKLHPRDWGVIVEFDMGVSRPFLIPDECDRLRATLESHVGKATAKLLVKSVRRRVEALKRKP